MPVDDDLKLDRETYDRLHEQLENEHWGEWVIIVNGEIAAIHPSFEEADRISESKFPNAPVRMVRKVGDGSESQHRWKVQVDLTARDIELLMIWAEHAYRTRFGIGDAPLLTVEEDALMKKLQSAFAHAIEAHRTNQGSS